MYLSRGVAAVVAGVVLATSGATSGVAVAGAGESVTLTGTYQRMAKEVDDGVTQGHAYDDLLVTPSRTYRLRLRGAPPKPGSTVRISANTTATGPLQVTRTTSLASAPVPSAIGPTTTLAILVHWGSPDSVTQASAKSQLFGDTNNWVREASYGQTSLSGAVTPWVRITAPSNGRCYDYADQIMMRAKAGAVNLGYDPEAYHRTLVYFPRCTASDSANLTGWAFEPGDSIWLNGVMDRRTSTHEHGHSFGIGHARSYACTVNGVRVTLSSSCAAAEYGDPYDAMGNSAYAGHFNGLHKAQLGWLGGTRKHVMTTSSGTFTLAPFEKPSTLPLTVVANSPTYGRHYWFEYRQPVGMDARFPAGATGGVMIHFEDSALTAGSFLLDPTPSDSSFGAAVLGPGRSWTAPDGVKISVNSVSTSGASITVTGARPEPTPPSAPRYVTTQAGHNRVLVSWLPPSSDGNSDLRRYVVSVGNGAAYSVDADATSYLVTGLTNDVARTFAVTAENDAGGGPASAPVTATPRASTVPPTVSFRSPVPGATVSGTVTPVVDVKVDTLLRPAQYKEWYVDGVRVRIGETFDWSTPDYANGAHVLRVVARDELDRLAQAEATYHVLNQRPSLAITAPAADAQVTGGAVTLAATAGPSDDGSPVERVDFFAGGSFLGADRTAPYEVPWDVTHASDATWTLTVRAYDAAGRSSSATRRVTVYHRPPTVSVTSPAQYTKVRTPSLTVTADAATGTPGVALASVTFTSPFGSVIDREAPYAATFDTSSATGSSWVEVRATDVSGRSAYSSRYFTLDNPLPALTVTSPSTSPQRTHVLTFAGTAKPSTSGAAVSKVTVSLPFGSADAPVAADGTWSLPVDVKGRYGTYTAVVTALDTSGYSARTTRSVTLQRPPPVVTFTLPSATMTTTAPVDLVARVEPAADAVHTVSRVCFYLESYYVLACPERGADGTYAAPVQLPSAGPMNLSVQVLESDGFAMQHASRRADVFGPPGMPSYVYGSAGVDATVTVRWDAAYASPWTPVEGYVVRDEHGAVMARASSSPVTFTPPRLGDAELYSLEAVNRWGSSPRHHLEPITAQWYTVLAPFTASRDVTTYPGTVTFSARLAREDGTPIPGQTLYLQQYSTWSSKIVGQTSVTSTTGWASVTFAPSQSAHYTLNYQGGGAYGHTNSDLLHVGVRALVTGNLTRGRMPLGATTTFDGRVQPAAKDKFVYLQRYYAGAWRNVTYRKQDAYGRVSIPIRPTARGTYTYRLYYGGDPLHLGNTSPARNLAVY